MPPLNRCEARIRVTDAGGKHLLSYESADLPNAKSKFKFEVPLVRFVLMG